MDSVGRSKESLTVSWADGATDSTALNLKHGCFGTLLVPSGLNGKTLQVRSSETAYNSATYNLLTTAKTLATGKNAFSADEIRDIGAASGVVFVLSSAVSGAQTARLLWSS